MDVKCKLLFIAVHYNIFLFSYNEQGFLQLLACVRKLKVMRASLFVVVWNSWCLFTIDQCFAYQL